MAWTARKIAADLRRFILLGRKGFRPGETLPTMDDLAERYGVAYQTARSAVVLLRQANLVDIRRHAGTVVRDQPVRRRIGRSRQVYRDEIGYYFDAVAQPWRALQTPTITWEPAPLDIASILGVEIGEEVLVRDRRMGDPKEKRVYQLATSYLPGWLARGTVLERPNTGPGGIYDRMEKDLGHGPLRWSEAVGARAAWPEEAEALGVPDGAPLLRITRTTTDSSGKRVLEVNDTRMNAELFEIPYSIRRHASARTARLDPEEDQDR